MRKAVKAFKKAAKVLGCGLLYYITFIVITITIQLILWSIKIFG